MEHTLRAELLQFDTSKNVRTTKHSKRNARNNTNSQSPPKISTLALEEGPVKLLPSEKKMKEEFEQNQMLQLNHLNSQKAIQKKWYVNKRRSSSCNYR